MPQLGQGILKGMGVTLQHLFGQKITRQYPEYKRELPNGAAGCSRSTWTAASRACSA